MNQPLIPFLHNFPKLEINDDLNNPILDALNATNGISGDTILVHQSTLIRLMENLGSFPFESIRAGVLNNIQDTNNINQLIKVMQEELAFRKLLLYWDNAGSLL